MSIEGTSSDGTIGGRVTAIILLVAISGVVLIHPFFIPQSTSSYIWGLPAWYWSELAFFAVIYAVFYVFVNKSDGIFGWLYGGG